MQSDKLRSIQCIVSLVVVLMLGSCATVDMKLPATLPEPERQQADAAQPEAVSSPAEQVQKLQMKLLPALDVASWNIDNDTRWADLGLPPGTLSLRADAIPLNEFIHLALGDTLKLSFTVDKDVASRTDPVTLHISKPVEAQRLLGLVEQALGAFGIGLTMGENGVRVVSDAVLKKTPPHLISSASRLALHQGKVMTIIPLTYAHPSEAMSFSQLMLQSEKGSYMNQLPRLNAILVIGMPDRVKRFRQAVEMIDRPSMKGKHAMLIRPVYWKVEALVKALEEGLASQGVKIAHTASEPGLRLIAMKEINALMVISPDKTWSALLKRWVRQLDNVESVDALGEGDQAFVYFVRFSRAAKLGETLTAVLGGGQSQQAQPVGTKTGAEPASAHPVMQKSVGAAIDLGEKGHLRVVADEEHNALVFVGSARSYRVAYQLLQQLDRPAKQVLIEATVADISLDESTKLGIEWAFTNVDNSTGLSGTLGTIGGLGVGSGGLLYTLANAAGDVRAKINALASSGKAKILSSPRLLARDNEEARIQVGTQVAVLSQEIGSTAGTTGTTTGLLRSFSYIDTGVILTFTPTVMESGAVQLKVSQEVSEAGTSTNNTPPISTRNVSTVLVVQSGQTIMIGGLITHNKGVTKTKVPFLGDIPILGQLFSNTSVTDRSTEMVILITPHVIESATDADYLTRAFVDKLGWEQGSGDDKVNPHVNGLIRK